MLEPWLDHYDAGVPRSITSYPDKTLVDFVREHARSRPGDIAIVFKGRRITYAQLYGDAISLAGALVPLGIRSRDRVALVLPNCPQFIIAELAVWLLGGIIVPLNPTYTERELEQALRTIQPETAIVLTPFYEKIKRCQPVTHVRRVIATNVKEYLPATLRIAFTFLKEKSEGHRITLRRNDYWFQRLIAQGRHNAIVEPVARPDDVAAILMSGGTTGTPKGVLCGHRGFVASGIQLAAWLNEAIGRANASILLPLPLFHTYGCAGVQSMAMVAGIPLSLVPNPRDIGDLLKTIDRDHPSLVCGVPALFSAILNHRAAAAGRIDFSSVKACFSGAAPLMAETKKRFEQLTGARIVEGYSLTEATMACCLNPYRGENKIGSVGMPMPDVKVRIVESENGVREVPIGEVGEVVISAPQLMLGYWMNAEETAQTLRLLSNGSTGLYTGDLGYLDGDGYLFLVDRKKDLIKTSGFQVWPREIEEVISTHPAVAEVGVAGLPDERKGEIVAAWIVLRPGMSTSPADIRSYCKETLAPYKVPTRIEFRGELPKTMIGKVLRRALVAEVQSQLPSPACSTTSGSP